MTGDAELGPPRLRRHVDGLVLGEWCPHVVAVPALPGLELNGPDRPDGVVGPRPDGHLGRQAPGRKTRDGQLDVQPPADLDVAQLQGRDLARDREPDLEDGVGPALDDPFGVQFGAAQMKRSPV